MKRGEPFEMVLAVLGTVAWLVIGLMGIVTHDVPGLVIGAGLTALSVLEIVRWQQGQPALAISSRTRSRRGDLAVPTTAWFGLGGLSAAFVLGVVWALRDHRGAASSPNDIPWLVPIVYLIFGALAAWLLSRNFDRRERGLKGERVKSGKPEIPPPPSPSRESVDAHNETPHHELGGPTATLYHLQREHGVELDAFSSNDVALRTHDGLHANARSI